MVQVINNIAGREIIGNYEHVEFRPNIFYWTNVGTYEQEAYFPEHWHHALEISYVISGNKTMNIDGIENTYQKGDITLVNSEALHDISCEKGLTGLVLMINRDYLEYVNPDLKGKNFYLEKESEAYNKVQKLMAELIEPTKQKERLKMNIIVSQILEVLIDECISNTSMNKKQSFENKMILIRQIISYLEIHYRHNITLDEISKKMNYNKSYISNLFNKLLGIGIFEYLKNIRMEHVLHDLKDSNDNVTIIAYRNGFTNIQVFNRNFKKLYGMTPQEYRQKD